MPKGVQTLLALGAVWAWRWVLLHSGTNRFAEDPGHAPGKHLVEHRLQAAGHVMSQDKLPQVARTIPLEETDRRRFACSPSKFLLSGLRSAGRTRPSAGGDRAALRAVLAATKDFDGVTGKFSIGPTGAAERRLPILTIVGGKIRPAGGPPSPN